MKSSYDVMEGFGRPTPDETLTEIILIKSSLRLMRRFRVHSIFTFMIVITLIFENDLRRLILLPVYSASNVYLPALQRIWFP